MAIRPFIHYRRADLDVQITYDDVTNRLVGASATNNTGHAVIARVAWPGGSRTITIPPGTFSVALPAGLQLTMIDGSLGLQGFTWDIGG